VRREPERINENMELSIIIVNYRGWDRLKECLESLALFVPRFDGIEVIVADNNSADGVLDQFSEDWPGFVFIANKVNGGFAYACNEGSKVAKGKFLLFLNPDTVAPEESVMKLLHFAGTAASNLIISCRQVDKNGRESKAFGVFPRFGTLTGPGRAIFRFFNRKQEEVKVIANESIIKPDWVSGSVIMISREAFRNLGGFDEDFWMYFEDMDLCRRLRDLNGEIVFLTNVTIQHDHGGSSRINLKTTALTKTEVLISNHLYISKHNEGIVRLLLESWLIFYNLITLFFESLAGLLLFFRPGMFSKVILFGRLTGYYTGALVRLSWVSPRSVNFERNYRKKAVLQEPGNR
jgi:GT2 family glycosyltransferase